MILQHLNPIHQLKAYAIPNQQNLHKALFGHFPNTTENMTSGWLMK